MSIARRIPLAALVALALAACDGGPTDLSDKGELQISVSGTGVVTPAVRVTGPGFETTITTSQTLTLAPGTYTIEAPSVTSPVTLYSAAPTQTATVSLGQSTFAGVRYSAQPIAGAHVPGLDPFDSTMIAFMAARNIRSATLAVSSGGTLRYSRAFGWKDAAQTTALDPNAMFRLASVGKAVTAAAVRKLASEGKFSLSTPVFEYLGITPAGAVADARIYNITIDHLLQHTGGWDREIFGDFVFSSRTIAQEMGLSTAPSKTQVAQWAMTKPLQFTPGSKSAYCNFGFSLLGLVIEKASGMSYIDYVKQNIFTPAAASFVISGRSLPADRDAREPFYSHPTTGCLVFEINTCTPVTFPDGAFHMEAFDAFGGLVASAPAIASFLEAYWIPGQPRTGSGLTYYFFGSLPGTYTLARQRADGVNYVVLFNQRVDASGQAYDQIMGDLDLAASRARW